MEILRQEDYPQAEAFVRSHPAGSFMQSPAWGRVKQNWKQEIVVQRGADGALCGSMSILIRPMGPGALMYAPRGPVCDYQDRQTLSALLAGAAQVAKRYHAHLLRMDPYILEGDEARIGSLCAAGCSFTPGAAFRATIQPRYNYMVTGIAGLDEAALMARFSRKTRYDIRYPEKQGVTCRFGPQFLDDFYSLYAETGQRQGFRVRPRKYFARFLAAFPQDARLYLCHTADGQPICGGLSVNYAGRTAHVYGCSSDAPQLRRLRATYLLQWEMMKWALSTGCSVYDMQGVAIRPEDSLPLYNVLAFKQNFTGEIVTTAGEFCVCYRPALNRALQAAMGLRSRLLHR